MSIPTQASRFEQDVVRLAVDQYAGSVPVMSTSFCEDIRYWSDETEEPIGDDRVFLRLPDSTGFIPVEPQDGLELGVLYLPPEWIQHLGITYVPTEIDFYVTQPSFSSQLERFY